jgi:hypothetical protein
MLGTTISGLARKLTVAATVAALSLFTGGRAFGAVNAFNTPSDLKVHVTIQIKGHVEGLDEHHLVEIAENALVAAHIIAEHHGGAGIIEVHIEIHGNPDHGLHLTGSGGEWHEDADCVTNHINDMLVEMIHHFIDKAQHH